MIDLNDICNKVRNNEAGTFSIQYGGTPTISLFSEKVYPFDTDGVTTVDVDFIEDDFELLIGTK